eukprot:7447461-Pyramimonas_sp.AAC.1
MNNGTQRIVEVSASAASQTQCFIDFANVSCNISSRLASPPTSRRVSFSLASRLGPTVGSMCE